MHLFSNSSITYCYFLRKTQCTYVCAQLSCSFLSVGQFFVHLQSTFVHFAITSPRSRPIVSLDSFAADPLIISVDTNLVISFLIVPTSLSDNRVTRLAFVTSPHSMLMRFHLSASHSLGVAILKYLSFYIVCLSFFDLVLVFIIRYCLCLDGVATRGCSIPQKILKQLTMGIRREPRVLIFLLEIFI